MTTTTPLPIDRPGGTPSQSDRRPRPRRGARTRGPATLAFTCLTALVGFAAAHATIVFGTLTTDPAPAVPTGTTTLQLEMVDPVDAPVEDAIVLVEATPPSGESAFLSEPFEETAPGVYAVDVVLDEPGPWTLLLRDQTFRQEEARATLQLDVGPGGDDQAIAFLFPPTATGPQGIATWLIWLIGLPLVVGAIVTVMVLRGGGAPAEAEAAGPENRSS